MVPASWRRASGLVKRHFFAGIVGLCTLSLVVAVIVVPGAHRTGRKNPGVTAPDRPDGHRIAANGVVAAPSIAPSDSESPTASLSSSPDAAPIANGDASDPQLSADGRYLAFSSKASNLVSGDTNSKEDVFVRDLVAGTIERVSLAD